MSRPSTLHHSKEPKPTPPLLATPKFYRKFQNHPVGSTILDSPALEGGRLRFSGRHASVSIAPEPRATASTRTSGHSGQVNGSDPAASHAARRGPSPAAPASGA